MPVDKRGVFLLSRRRRPRRRRRKEPASVKLARMKEKEENLPTEIQGRKVRSKDEARVAVALGMLGYGFRYQVSIKGGNQRKGGFVLDFLVFTSPLPTPMPVQSEYWHLVGQRRAEIDKIQMAYMRKRFRGIWAEPKPIWDHQTRTVAQTYSTLRKMIGGA